MRESHQKTGRHGECMQMMFAVVVMSFTVVNQSNSFTDRPNIFCVRFLSKVNARLRFALIHETRETKVQKFQSLAPTAIKRKYLTDKITIRQRLQSCCYYFKTALSLRLSDRITQWKTFGIRCEPPIERSLHSYIEQKHL